MTFIELFYPSFSLVWNIKHLMYDVRNAHKNSLSPVAASDTRKSK